MSSKQMAYCAVHGRPVTFHWVNRDLDLTGYIVGMDDYHYLVATPQDETISVQLIHKASPDVVRLSGQPSLDDESPAVRIGVENVGRGFWAYCERTYLGRSGGESSSNVRAIVEEPSAL